MSQFEINPDTLRWILDLAYDVERFYLNLGSPEDDYGDEWPEVARTKAAHCFTIALSVTLPGEQERWRDLGIDFLASIKEGQ